MRPYHVASALLLVAVACSGAQDQDEQAGPSSADSVMMAAARYDPTNFDTIQWQSDAEAVVRGSVVFSYSCAKCHGPHGAGDGNRVTRGDTLRPPSFLTEDWAYADDPDGLRELVFTGAEGGMPHWGLEGLQYRDVDAVARFILEELRKES